jgi:hypothetical protein
MDVRTGGGSDGAPLTPADLPSSLPNRASVGSSTFSLPCSTAWPEKNTTTVAASTPFTRDTKRRNSSTRSSRVASAKRTVLPSGYPCRTSAALMSRASFAHLDKGGTGGR